MKGYRLQELLREQFAKKGTAGFEVKLVDVDSGVGRGSLRIVEFFDPKESGETFAVTDFAAEETVIYVRVTEGR
jgi:hypothetical protein